MENKVNEETLREMYCGQKLSIREIARTLGASKGQIEYLLEIYNVPKRTTSEAKIVTDNKVREIKAETTIESLTKKVSKFHVNTDFPPVTRKNMLIPIPLSHKAKDATLTLVISDLHIGDSNHLPETYWSTVSNAIEVIRNILGLYKVKKFNLVLNGDITNGVDVYRNQEFNNLIQRPHWQVFATEMVIKDTIERFNEVAKTDKIVLVKGTHDNMGNNLAMYLKRLMTAETTYLSQGGIFDIGDKNTGSYNLLFMHGYGYSNSNPVSYKMFNDARAVIEMYSGKGIVVDRICTSHTHWLSSGFIVGNLYWDVTGGYQKWEGTINQRPAGFILYLYSNNEVVSIPIRPDLDVEDKEKSDPSLNYRNYVYYGNILLRHLKEIEKIDS